MDPPRGSFSNDCVCRVVTLPSVDQGQRVYCVDWWPGPALQSRPGAGAWVLFSTQFGEGVAERVNQSPRSGPTPTSPMVCSCGSRGAHYCGRRGGGTRTSAGPPRCASRMDGACGRDCRTRGRRDWTGAECWRGWDVVLLGCRRRYTSSVMHPPAGGSGTADPRCPVQLDRRATVRVVAFGRT